MKFSVFLLLLLSSFCFAESNHQLQVNVKTGHNASVTSHFVTLSWTAPTGNVAGYNIYRATTSGGQNYSTPLNTTLIPAGTTTYTDNAVVGLGVYFYTAEAVCTTCNPQSSGPSNQVQATIPGDPQLNPPTNLTAVSQ